MPISASEQKRLGFEGFEPFDTHSQSYWLKAGETFRRLLCEGIQTSADKQGSGIAQDVNASPTQFSEALRGVNGRHFSAVWVPRAVHADPQDRALTFLAAIRKRRLVPHVKLTKAQIAAVAIKVMLEDGTAGRALLEKGFGPDVADVVAAVLGEDPP
jgi:hypothetical protein